MSDHDASPLFPSQPGDAAGARPTVSLLGQREGLSAGLRNAEGEMNAMDCRRMAGETFSEGFESRRRINVVEKIQNSIETVKLFKQTRLLGAAALVALPLATFAADEKKEE